MKKTTIVLAAYLLVSTANAAIVTIERHITNLPAEDILLAGLRWRSGRWTALAVSWITQGAPISENVADELELVAQDRHLVQKVRQEAFAAVKKWRKAKTKAGPGAPPNGGPAERFGNSGATGEPPSVS